MTAAVERGMRLASVEFAMDVLRKLEGEGVLKCSLADAMNLFDFDSVVVVSRRSKASKKREKDKSRSAEIAKSAKVTVKPSVLLPFCGVVVNDWCGGVKFNHGLHTQCSQVRLSGDRYCKTCRKHADNSATGKPPYGDIDDRAKYGVDYRDPKGKQTLPYANIVEKMGINLAAAHEAADKMGWTIPEEQLVKRVAKRGRPAKSAAVSDTDSENDDVKTSVKKKRGRPVKVKKVKGKTQEDQIAQLVAEAYAETIPLASVEAMTDKKGAKEAAKVAKKEAAAKAKADKKAAKEAAMVAKKEAAAKAKADKKAAKEAAKLAKKEAAAKAKADKLAAKKLEKEKKAAANLAAKADKLAKAKAKAAAKKAGKKSKTAALKASGDVSVEKKTVKTQASVMDKDAELDFEDIADETDEEAAIADEEVAIAEEEVAIVKEEAVIADEEAVITEEEAAIAEKPVAIGKEEAAIADEEAEEEEEAYEDSSDDEGLELSETMTVGGVEYFFAEQDGQTILFTKTGEPVGIYDADTDTVQECDFDDE
jgi:hypothetical protein